MFLPNKYSGKTIPSTMLRAIVIDDEPESLQAVTAQIRNFCPQVEIIDACDSAELGIQSIRKFQPDLIFLDIEMPGMTGLEMLRSFDQINFGVIFITAHNEYAIDAIKLSALDYLLKPLDIEQLEEAVKKAEEKYSREKTLDRFQLMMELMEGRPNASNQQTQSQTIALPTMDSIIYEKVSNIINIEAHQNYCKFYFENRDAILISRNIGSYEDSLTKFNFMRVHRSHMVNLDKVDEFKRTDGGALIMTNGRNIDISRSKKEEVLKRLEGNI